MMATTTPSLRRYDHRLRELVQSTGNIQHAIRRGVPRSTAHGWLQSPRADVVTVDATDMDVLRLQQGLLTLRRRVARLIALLRLLVVLLRLSGFSLAGTRIPHGAGKHTLMQAIERSTAVLPLHVVLRVLRLSHSRYHWWKREKECGLDDITSCPRSSPQQLTPAEVDMMRKMVTSDEYRHVPTGTLALLAQRLGKVFASSSTWYRLIRIHDWRRPRARIHPAKPKVGIRASRPNEIWHVDTTLIYLLDGSRASPADLRSIHVPPSKKCGQTEGNKRQPSQARVFVPWISLLHLPGNAHTPLGCVNQHGFQIVIADNRSEVVGQLVRLT